MGKGTIFFSYGRDQANPNHINFVKSVKFSLETEGFDVLIDVEQLKTGVDWEIQLEKDILRSDWILFFITPYSARRPDGYCLNEISFGLSKKKTILPLMINFEVPPLSICRIQYLDFQNLHGNTQYNTKIQEIIAVLSGEKQLGFEGGHTSLINMLEPLKTKNIIAKHIYRFIGRRWLYEEVDQWIKEDKDSRVLWITAEAGYGKSALATFLSQSHPSSISIHFCQYDNMETKNPINMLKTLIYELSTQVPAYYEKLLSINLKEKLDRSAVHIIRELLIEPLFEINRPDRDLVFIIDGLDEAKESDGKNPIVEIIANHFSDLPQWLNIIITSRPEPELIRKLKKFNPVELKANKLENYNDCKEFILQEMKNVSDCNIQTLINKCEGNMLYLKNILEFDSIKDGNFTLEDIDKLPIGMEGFYQQYFERKFDDIMLYEVELLSFVNIIVASKEGMPLDLINYILDINERSCKKKIDSLGSLLEENDDIVTFYHKSLFDWLSDYDLSGDYSADIDNGNKLISERLWKLYKAENKEDLPKNYESYLLQSLYQQKAFEKLDEILKDILFIGNVYGQKRHSFYKKILISTINSQTVKCDIESLKIYESFFREKEHLLLAHENQEICKASHNLFQLAYEDGENSPLSKSADLLLLNNKIDFLWIKKKNRPRTFIRLGFLRVLHGHTSKITGARLLRDGRILSYSSDNILRLWSSKGKPLAVLQGHTENITGVKDLRNGKILSYSEDKSLRIWSSDGEPLAVLEGHTGNIKGMTTLMDGRILSYSSDRTLRLWSSDGEPLAVLEGHTDNITGVKDLGDGKILSCSFDKTLRLWSAEGEPLAVLVGHTDSIMGMKVFPDGKILSYSWDKTLRLWSSDGEPLAVLEGHTWYIKVAIILNDKKILSYQTGGGGTLRLWSSEGEPLAVMEGHTDNITGVKDLRDGKILSYSFDKTLRLWNTDGKALGVLKGHTNFINGVVVLSDGRILSYSWDETLRLWSAEGEPLAVLEGHTGKINGVTVLNDGRILSYSEDCTMRLWSSEGEPLAVLEGHTDNITGIKVFRDGKILSYSEDKTLRIWSAEKNSLVINRHGHTKKINKAIVLSNGRILSYSSDRTLRLWSAEGEPLAVLEGHTGNIEGMTILMDGRILSYSSDRTLRLWSSEGEPVAVLEGHSGKINGATILSDGRILSYSWDETLRLWSSDGKALGVLTGHTNFINGVVVLSDGRILSYSWDETLRLWSAEGEPLAVLEGHTGNIEGTTILMDGRILSYSSDRTLRLWNSEGKFSGVLEGHIRKINGATILSDGRILSYSWDKTLRLWSTQGEPLAVLEGHTGKINGVSVLSDGRILSYTEGGTMRLWSSEGESLAILHGHTDNITGVKDLGDGKILSYSEDKTLRLWSSAGVQLKMWCLAPEVVDIFEINNSCILASKGNELLIYDFFLGNQQIKLTSFNQ